MKNSILFTFVLCSLSLGICQAQWLPELRLTNNSAGSGTSFNNAWCVAANEDAVHVVWYDERNANFEIYYKRSASGGLFWGADVRLTNNPSVSAYPSVAVSGSIVHVVWYDERDGNSEIYYKRSTDGGINWGADIRLTNSSGNSGSPSISISGSAVVHVVWVDNRDGNYEIYYKRSTNLGVSWQADTRLTSNSASQSSPSVSVSGSLVHAVWMDLRDGNYEIYDKRSPDGGVSWGTDTRLTNNSAVSFSPSVSISGQDVHVVWRDNRDGNDEIYHKHSTNGGIYWQADSRVTNNSESSVYPSVSASGVYVHIVWYDYRNGTYPEIYYTRSTNKGTSWGSDVRLTNSLGSSGNPSVAASGLSVHVVWQDDKEGNAEIYHKYNPTGNPIGITNISSEIPEEYSLSQNYPNPFNPTTKIKFEIPLSRGVSEGRGVFIKLTVYNALGEQMAILVNEDLAAGVYEVEFNASSLPSGVYFYTLSTAGFTQTKRMVLVK